MISFEWIPPFLGLALFLGSLWLLYRTAFSAVRLFNRVGWRTVVTTLSVAAWVSMLIMAPTLDAALINDPDSWAPWIGLISVIAIFCAAGPVMALLWLRDRIANRPRNGHMLR